MNKVIILLVFICVFFSGCNKNNQNSNYETNSMVTIETAYNTVTIDAFKKKYNATVANENIKINNWTEKMPGIVEYSFNNQITLSLGISPNEKNLVHIPQLFSNIVEISKIDNFPEILYGILKVEDDTVTLEQAEIVADKISLDQSEMMMIDLPYNVFSKKEIVNNIVIDVSYLDKKLGIMFYDVNMIEQ